LPQSATEKQLATQPPYRLAFLGRWHSNKGADLLVKSLKHLATDDWQHIEKIKICGGGPLEKLIEAGVIALQAENRAVELLLWADYVLLPSRIESIPVIFSDAMKCRSPIISMPVGDLPRLVTDYQVGVLAENVSAIAFAQAIRQALQQAPLDFESGLLRATTDFDLETIVKNWLLDLEII
jgi:glycosyltransferase involved in cell wall biosynthesis